jgi:uncharacterized membrane protein YphA (DoxX/SURF4 family)
MAHGAQKLFGMFGMGFSETPRCSNASAIRRVCLGHPRQLHGNVRGLLLAIGLFTRPAAVIVIFMIFTILLRQRASSGPSGMEYRC